MRFHGSTSELLTVISAALRDTLLVSPYIPGSGQVRHEFAQYRRDHATLAQLQARQLRVLLVCLRHKIVLASQREICSSITPATRHMVEGFHSANAFPSSISRVVSFCVLHCLSIQWPLHLEASRW